METKYPSPDGRYIFRIYPWEARMSLWIEMPQLMDTQTDQSVLRFSDSNWSLDDADWLDNTRVKIQLRRYPGDHTPSSFQVVVDCQNLQAAIEGGETVALGALEKELESMIRRGRANAQSSSPTEKPTGFAAIIKRVIG